MNRTGFRTYPLALSERRPTNECRSDLGIFYRVKVTSCNLCARAKVPGDLKIEQKKEREKERWRAREIERVRSDARSKTKLIPLLWGYVMITKQGELTQIYTSLDSFVNVVKIL